jgi:beta-fructofuranosidase
MSVRRSKTWLLAIVIGLEWIGGLRGFAAESGSPGAGKQQTPAAQTKSHAPGAGRSQAEREGDPEEYRQAVQRVANDPLRPKLHAIPPVFTMGDPNGLIQVKGTYHLFYQHAATFSANPRMHWGHMRSRDLLSWENLPIALRPEKCWHVASGSAVRDNGGITAIYTGAEPQQQCIATSQDEGLVTWKQYERNPVIAEPPKDLQVTGFRDPYVWREGREWVMGVGSGIAGAGGTVLLYKSPDLRNWEYVGQLCVGRKEETGGMWECPSLFSVGNKHVLTCNALPLPLEPARMKTVYFIGAYRDRKFQPEHQEDLDLFGEVWAPQVFVDEKGRRILFLLSWEARNGAAYGWSGAMSLPRVLSLSRDGRLHVQPVEELKARRHGHRSFGSTSVAPTSTRVLGDVRGDPVEIVAVFAPSDRGEFDAERFGVVVRRSPGGEEQTRVVFDARATRIWIDRTRSSLDPKVYRGSRPDRGRFALSRGEALRLHVFVDRSVLDVFANERAAGTTRIYPSRSDSLGIGLFAEGGTVRVRCVDVWELRF